jgi:protocatechuate 3,4-dioxygenase beta subunit
MAQSKEILDLKKTLKETAKGLENGCNPPTVTGDEAYPAVTLQEKPWADDNVFHVGEPLAVKVGIRDMTTKEVVPIPEEQVCIWQADGSSEWLLTDEEGIVEFKPAGAGTMEIDVPAILVYSSGMSFKVVE